MEKHLVLKNSCLEAEIRLPGSQPESERFDSSAVVSQVTLHSRHRFCQPEQRIAGRVTCWGYGLNAEYDMNQIGEEVRKGERFPKPGVGLLTQIEDCKPYDMWSHYEIERFPKRWEFGEDWIRFVEEPLPCLGIALQIERRLSLQGQQIVLETTVHNIGEREADFSEYQHNFVAIDDLPVDDGYMLDLPFDGTLGELPKRFRRLSDFTPINESSVKVEGQTAIWTAPMDGRTYHKTTEADDILPCEHYGWTLRHRDNPARVSELCGFKPDKLVLWGIEHCVCAEVYHNIHVTPGASHSYTRTWLFEDEQ